MGKQVSYRLSESILKYYRLWRARAEEKKVGTWKEV
jgi:hypothetical protein